MKRLAVVGLALALAPAAAAVSKAAAPAPFGRCSAGYVRADGDGWGCE